MIHDVDEAIRTLLRRDALGSGSSGVDISFDAPTRDWASRQNTPVIDVYLYDIRENLNRREVAYEEIRDASGRVIERRPPPRRFKLSYLLTAWTQRPEDEHRLLSSALACFLRHEKLPDDVLSGTLANQPLAVSVSIALPPSQDRAISDIWSALGGELKPSLDLVINAPFDTGRFAAAGPPVVEPIVGVRGPVADPEAAAAAAAAAAAKPKRRARGSAPPLPPPAAESPPDRLGPDRLGPDGLGPDGLSPDRSSRAPGERKFGGTEAQPGRTVVAHRIGRDGEPE